MRVGLLERAGYPLLLRPAPHHGPPNPPLQCHHHYDVESKSRFSDIARLVRLIADEGNDHAVEIEEEHEQVEAQLDERFLSSVSGLYRGR